MVPARLTDEEKHAWCKMRNGIGAVFVPPALYDAAESAGMDMRWYVRAAMIPKQREGEKSNDVSRDT
jgi:hypothetical protein